MATQQFMELLNKREAVYSKRVQYCLLLTLVAALPLIAFSSVDGVHIKSFTVLIKQFGDVGLAILLSLIIITVLVGLSSLWKLYKTLRLKAKYEWSAYSLR